MSKNTVREAVNKLATTDELFKLGTLVKDYFIEALQDQGFTSDQVDKILSDKAVLKTCVKQYANTCLNIASADEFSMYRTNLKKFFADVYDITIPPDFLMRSSEEFEHYMIVPEELDIESIFQGYDRVGLSKDPLLDKTILHKKSSESYRPEKTYFFCHVGGEEADADCCGKSIEDLIGTFMNIEEYMLVDQFMWWNFKMYIDRKGWTKTMTRVGPEAILRAGKADKTNVIMIGSFSSKNDTISHSVRRIKLLS